MVINEWCLDDVQLLLEWRRTHFWTLFGWFSFFIFDGSWSCCRFCVVYIMSEWCLNDVWVISEWCLDVVSMMFAPCLSDVWKMFAHCIHIFLGHRDAVVVFVLLCLYLVPVHDAIRFQWFLIVLVTSGIFARHVFFCYIHFGAFIMSIWCVQDVCIHFRFHVLLLFSFTLLLSFFLFKWSLPTYLW